MKSNSDTPQRKWSLKGTMAISIIVLLSIVAFLLYNNFDQLMSQALLNAFNSSIVSDVYELKFERLAIIPIEGTVRMFNVTLSPREKPLKEYPYINSSFHLKAERITLKNVSFVSLLKSKQLKLERISIHKPDVELMLAGKRHILLPFEDSTSVENPSGEKKKMLDSLILNEFHLIDASIHTVNANQHREFKIKNFTISLYELLVNQYPGEYRTSCRQGNVSIGEFNGALQKGAIRHLGFKDFNIGVDSLAIQYTLDTLTYRFHDFHAGLNNLDIQTADSIFHVTLQSFDLSYQDKSIKLKEVSFKPNVSHAVLQKKHQYQHTEFSGSVGKLTFNQVNFDSLIYVKKLFIDEVVLDHVKAAIFKDKTKPIDSTRRPVYLGQTMRAISLPLLIKQVKATHVELENTERKPDSTLAKVNLTKATLGIKNITNLSKDKHLLMSADAYIENKAHFKASLTFYYDKPQFDFEAIVLKFDLPDLNSLIRAYTPAKITKGTVDEIKLSGVAEHTTAFGTFNFLYHDLEVDLELHEQAKWKSSVIAFAANTILTSNNPGSAKFPPRVVQFHIERDMNKGFVNVVIKSLLNGLKETMIMSKENRKVYKVAKKKFKQENKK